MAYPGKYDFNYYEGDTYEFNIYPKTADGGTFDISTFTAKFFIATSRGSGSTQYECSATISDNKVACKIPAGTGRSLTAGTPYVYDVQIERVSDGTVYTLLTGNISVTADVTGA